MTVHNVRFGFATNSSSNHSLVFLPADVKAKDDYEPWEFGWDKFTLVSADAKRHYLGIVLWTFLRNSMPEEISRLILRKLIKTVPGKDDYVDHQSHYPLPADFHHPEFPDATFFKELRDFILQPGLAILGGNDNNDNSDEAHRLAKYGSFRIPEGRTGDLVCRKDPQGYWTIFSRKDGTKVRFSFYNKKDMKVRPKKAYAPELVDVKITDCCSKGCPWCYQDSEPDGTYADSLYRLTEALSELRVFEVALGGGEPTSHPDFVNIVASFREAGVVPNFSTKSLDWLRDNRKWPSVVDNCGKFAFSVNTLDEAKDFMALVHANGIDRDKVGFQAIVGVIDWWEYAHLLELAAKEGLSITLLGYKPVGRGKAKPPKQYDNRTWWLDHIAKMKSYVRVGIDTVLAKEFETEIKSAKVSEMLYETEEGKFSCYVDAVRMMIGPSSFCEESQMQLLDAKTWELDGQIVEAFSKF